MNGLNGYSTANFVGISTFEGLNGFTTANLVLIVHYGEIHRN